MKITEIRRIKDMTFRNVYYTCTMQGNKRVNYTFVPKTFKNPVFILFMIIWFRYIGRDPRKDILFHVNNRFNNAKVHINNRFKNAKVHN